MREIRRKEIQNIYTSYWTIATKVQTNTVRLANQKLLVLELNGCTVLYCIYCKVGWNLQTQKGSILTLNAGL